MGFILHVIVPIDKVVPVDQIKLYVDPILTKYHKSQSKIRSTIHLTATELHTKYSVYCDNHSKPIAFLRFALNYLEQSDPNDDNLYEVDECGHIWNLIESPHAIIDAYDIRQLIPIAELTYVPSQLIDTDNNWVSYGDDRSEDLRKHILKTHINDYVVTMMCF